MQANKRTAKKDDKKKHLFQLARNREENKAQNNERGKRSWIKKEKDKRGQEEVM